MTNLELLKSLDNERLSLFLLGIIGFNSEQEKLDFEKWLNSPTSPKFFAHNCKEVNSEVEEKTNLCNQKLLDKINSQKEEILNLKRILNKILTE